MAQNYVLLETIQLTSTAASVTFDNIPQTGYTDLKIVLSARDSGTGDVRLRFNGVTTSSYTYLRMGGTGSATFSDTASQTSIYMSTISNQPGFTSNTFGNAEIYIPNYAGSNNKSISVVGVTENNATLSYASLGTGLFSNTAAITSILLYPDSGSFVAGSTFSLYGLAATGTTPAIAPFATGGNIVANDGTYWYHAFLSSGTFTPFKDLTCNALIVGGGGGAAEGGGGAGGYRLISDIAVTKDVQNTIAVGAGGTAGNWGALPYASNGVNSSAFTYISAGGGFGGLVNGQPGGAGGSGGGAGQVSPSATAGGTGNTPSTSPAQGTNGGSASTGANQYGGGGGGATVAGGGSSTSAGGAGGTGSSTASAYGLATTTGQNISGTVWYAGGGGGGGNGSVGAAGAGGGGVGGSGTTNNGTAGTGGGGGGAFGVTGGLGGSGIVIVRYPMVS
jgi:hypothetical protein